jgi:hypothetical protein
MKTINYCRQVLVVINEEPVEQAASSPKIAATLVNYGVEAILSVRKINGRRIHRLYKLTNGEYQEA